MGCGCEGKNPVGQVFSQAVLWFDDKMLSFSSGSIYVAADQWLDCRMWRDAYILLEFRGSGGSDLTVALETAPAMTTDDNAWQTVSSASTTMGSSAKVLQGKATLTVPPMAVLRLKFTAAASVQGVLRAQVVFKQGT